MFTPVNKLRRSITYTPYPEKVESLCNQIFTTFSLLESARNFQQSTYNTFHYTALPREFGKYKFIKITKDTTAIILGITLTNTNIQL